LSLLEDRECQQASYFSIFSEYFFISRKRRLCYDFIGFSVFQ
jgi:hypothetical protein